MAVADLQRHGADVAVSPRGALRKAVADWRALGYEPMVGVELEAYLLEPDGNGGWRPLDAPGSFVYGTGPSVDPHGVIDAIWRAADAADIPLESVNSEYDTPQFEFTLEYCDALRSADNAFLFKVLAREIGDRVTVIMPNTEIEVGVLKAGDQVDLFHDGQRFHASVRKAAV